MTIDPFRENARRASMAATRLHKRLATPFDRPVDVFLMAQRLGVWLAAQPLDQAFGFYLRQGEVAGIVVNSNHPESLQRYTCAHEIGHHVLNHQSHADLSRSINTFSQENMQELQAQVFAASLLMPLPLVERTLARVLGERQVVQAEDAYIFSRDLGVSYAAAVWHLAELRKISRSAARNLARISPAAIKDLLRGSKALTDARADVWFVQDEVARDSVVACRIDDEVHIRLREDLSSGHVWSVDSSQQSMSTPSEDAVWWDGADSVIEEPVSADAQVHNISVDLTDELFIARDEHVGSSQSSSGLIESDWQASDLPGPGYRSIVVVPHTEGSHRLSLSLRPAWDADAAPRQQIEFVVEASGRKTLPREGYAAPQRDLRVEELKAA